MHSAEKFAHKAFDVQVSAPADERLQSRQMVKVNGINDGGVTILQNFTNQAQHRHTHAHTHPFPEWTILVVLL